MIKYEKEQEFQQLCQKKSFDLEKIILLTKYEIDVNGKDEMGKNALHHLCQNNSSEKLIAAIQLLIQLGIDVNEKDKDGSNALHLLCYNDSVADQIAGRKRKDAATGEEDRCGRRRGRRWHYRRNRSRDNVKYLLRLYISPFQRVGKHRLK
jgi:ankyrin repeat protein